MSTSVLLPDEIYQKAAELARGEKVSVDELVPVALAEQFAAHDYLQRRAARASRGEVPCRSAPNSGPGA